MVFRSTLVLSAIFIISFPSLLIANTASPKEKILLYGSNTKAYIKNIKSNKKCITWQFFSSNFKKFLKADNVYDQISLPSQVPSKYRQGCVAFLNISSAAIQIGVWQTGVHLISNSRNPYFIPRVDNIVNRNILDKPAFTITRICLSGGVIRGKLCRRLGEAKKPFIYNDDGERTAFWGFTYLDAPDVRAENLLTLWRRQLNP